MTFDTSEGLGDLSDTIRLGFAAVATLRARAAQLGPDSEAAWRLLEVAAAAELDVLALESELDTLIASRPQP